MSDFGSTGTTQRYSMPHAEIPGCALVQDLIPLYLDGEVTPESHVLMADHLQRCERCSGYLAGARSVRSQILHEQQTLRAAHAAQPSVAQVREPVAASVGVTLWQLLMGLLYAGGLLLGVISLAGGPGAIPPLVLGAPLVMIALAGLLIVGSARTAGWFVLMLLTVLAGVFLIPLAIIAGGFDRSMLALYGMGMIGLGAWGVWLHHTLNPVPALQGGQYGARQALLTAGLSLGGLLMCGVITAASLIGVMQGGPPGQILVAGLLLLGSLVGMVEINRRRGWIPGALLRLPLPQLLGWLLLILGLVIGLSRL